MADKRAMFNTTIDKQIQNEFKAACKEQGIAMNVVLETFMKQFTKDEFILQIGDKKKMFVKLIKSVKELEDDEVE